MNPVFRPLILKRDWTTVQAHIGVIFSEDTKGVVAEDEDGRPLAIAVLDNWVRNSVCIHQAVFSSMILRRGWVEEICRYVFGKADRQYMVAQIPSNNEPSLKLTAHIGFQEVVRIPDHYATGIDLVIMRMDREDCRWYTPESSNGEERRQRARST